MRTYFKILSCFLFFSKLIAQQPYELFNSKSEFFFNQPILTDELVGLKCDSVKVSGTDSIYYHYRVLDYMTNSCVNARSTSWIGKQTKRRANGNYIFYNSTGDSIVFKTLSPVNSSWTCYTFPSGDYIKASVSAIQYEPTFDLQSDSVKTIILQAYNSSNAAITHSINGTVYKFSRTQGLIKWGNMKAFPGTTVYSRCFGKRFTKDEGFSFNIGDVLQIHFNSSNGSSGQNSYITYTFTAKSAGPSIVNYTANAYNYTQSASMQSTTITTSTTTQTFSVSNPAQIQIAEMPQQFRALNSATSGNKVSYYFNPQTENKSCKFRVRVRNCIDFAGSTDTCMAPGVSCQSNIWYDHYYKLGSYMNQTASANPTIIDQYPVYYASSTYSCGSYVITGVTERVKEKSQFVLYPNPAQTILNIKTLSDLNSEDEIIIYDLLNKIVLRQNFSNEIDVSALNSGVYFISAGNTRTKFIKSSN